MRVSRSVAALMSPGGLPPALLPLRPVVDTVALASYPQQALTGPYQALTTKHTTPGSREPLPEGSSRWTRDARAAEPQAPGRQQRGRTARDDHDLALVDRHFIATTCFGLADPPHRCPYRSIERHTHPPQTHASEVPIAAPTLLGSPPRAFPLSNKLSQLTLPSARRTQTQTQ